MKKPVNLLIIIEALVLTGVLVVCLASSGLSGIKSTDTTNEATTSGNELGGLAETDDEQEDEDTAGTSSGDTYETLRMTFSDEVEELLDSLTTEQLVAMLFITTPEELTGVGTVTVSGDTTAQSLLNYPVSGLIYSEDNLSSSAQAQALLSGTYDYSVESAGLGMLLIIEELGGEDASPAATACGLEVQDSPSELAATGSTSAVSNAASARAEYLADLGFNSILGPVADAATGTDDAFDALTYGESALNASDYVSVDVSAVESSGLISILQCFPGVKEATEDYSAYQAAIDAGVSCIQVSNIASSALTGDSSMPCTLSAETTRKLRDEMGFDGLLVTDDLSESAVTDNYDIADAAVAALKAGMNLLYVSDGFEEAYEAVLSAVESGEITQTVFMNAAGRVLEVRLEL